MSPKTAGRFLQIESQLLMIIDLQVASSLPIVINFIRETMLTRNTVITTALWLCVCQSMNADLLRLKSGSAVQGTLISADARGIRFETVRGETRTYGIADVDGVDFAPLPPPPPSSPTVSSALEC